ncbi:MAG: hypothetical protein IT372_36630 [Polyangiaceae bacterium]|nr:hypothetical protein [Polyangiaceae bacterium]
MTKEGQPRAPAEDAAPPAREDVVFVHGATECGGGYRVIRKRDDSIEIGEIRALEEGRPVHGDIVRLRPRSEHERLFDVEVLMDAPKQIEEARRSSGPAQVATDAYRTNWEAIFGRGDRGAPS